LLTVEGVALGIRAASVGAGVAVGIAGRSVIRAVGELWLTVGRAGGVPEGVKEMFCGVQLAKTSQMNRHRIDAYFFTMQRSIT
jgi:hypothetical protein